MPLLKNNAHAILKEVRAIAESDRFDYLLIESTGIGGSWWRWGLPAGKKTALPQ